MLGNRGAIKRTAEYTRIAALPRRSPEPPLSLVAQMTTVLKTPAGTEQLFPAQAMALHDIGTQGGLLGPMPVGSGKTIVSLLAPHVLEARRPLLLLPAALISKTIADRARLMKHWRVPRNIRLLSYEALGRVSASRELDLYRPDIIVADEAHRLKNPRAAVTRRVTRYMKEHPDVKFIALSGTLVKNSLRDFGTLAKWSLKDGAPLPLEWGELEEWADALDSRINPLARVGPGPLGPTVEAARDWFRERLLETPGVVGTTSAQVACSLRISTVEYPVSPVTEANFTKLRDTWEQPCGWPMSMATDVWRCARELALGVHYAWDPRPPDAWLDARRAWSSFVREHIASSQHANAPLDSELQVVQAIDGGHLKDGGLLATWRQVKPTFTVNSVPRWHDDSALKLCAEWLADKNHGIVWIDHTFFGVELSRRTGVPFYGAGGLDAKGRDIAQAAGPIIASRPANATGRNLQAWHRNLITCAPTGGDQWEQLLGRTHREGQEADEVTVEVLLGCIEHWDAIQKGLDAAEMTRAMMGQGQKILLADLARPLQPPKGGSRWARSNS